MQLRVCMPQWRLKIPHATAKDLICHNKDWRSHVPQLRPVTAKKKKKSPKSTAVLLLPAWLLLRLVFIWDLDDLSFNSQLHCPPNVFCHFPISPIAPASMRVLLTLCQSRWEIQSFASFCKSNAGSKEEFIRGQGTKRIVPSELHIIDLSPYCPSQSFPGETYLAPLEYAE